MKFYTKDVLEIIDSLELEELKELSKAQHKDGSRELDPIISPEKEGKMNVYSFPDLMLIELYKCAKNSFSSKEVLRALTDVPQQLNKTIKYIHKEMLNEELSDPYQINPFNSAFSNLTDIVNGGMANFGDGILESKNTNLEFFFIYISNHKHSYVKLNIKNKNWVIKDISRIFSKNLKILTESEFKEYNLQTFPVEVKFDLVKAHQFLKRRIYDLKIQN
jgi:hypothetical protein